MDEVDAEDAAVAGRRGDADVVDAVSVDASREASRFAVVSPNEDAGTAGFEVAVVALVAVGHPAADAE